MNPTRWIVFATLLVAAVAVPAASPSGPGTTALLVTAYRVKPDHVAQWLGLQKNDVLPALRKAQANGTFAGLTVTVSGHGGEWGLITPLAWIVRRRLDDLSF